MKVGMGFLAGRANVCEVINHYYKSWQNQILEQDQHAEIIFYILYDLNYKQTKLEDFYKIKEEVRNSGCQIKYIGEEEIEKEKEKLMSQYQLSNEDVDLLIGGGYARARNTIMEIAVHDQVDYLLFWDDDEYPVACLKENEKVIWKEQNDLTKHLTYIPQANVTFGYHCGYISPIPYIDFDKYISEEDFKNYIDAVSNEAVTWEKN